MYTLKSTCIHAFQYQPEISLCTILRLRKQTSNFIATKYIEYLFHDIGYSFVSLNLMHNACWLELMSYDSERELWV